MEARLRHSVDGDGWKAVARAAAQEAISEFLPDARESLSAGKPLAEVAATLTDEARELTRDILFNHVRSTGMMTPKTRIRYCPTLPGYRRSLHLDHGRRPRRTAGCGGTGPEPRGDGDSITHF